MVFEAQSEVEVTSQGLAYDLRQTYAMLVSERIRKLDEARDSSDFREYLIQLRKLFIVVRHRLVRLEVDLEPYQKFMKEIQIMVNENPNVWNGNKKNREVGAIIENKLMDFEMWLWEAMDEAKIFGDREYEYDPDEI